MERRKFIRNSFLTGAASITVGQSFAGNKNGISLTENKPFNLDYAIHDGMFKNHAGDNFLDQIQFAYDNGFRSVEDNGMRGRDAETQKKIGEKLAKLNMKMGVFVAMISTGKNLPLLQTIKRYRKNFFHRSKNLWK